MAMAASEVEAVVPGVSIAAAAHLCKPGDLEKRMEGRPTSDYLAAILGLCCRVRVCTWLRRSLRYMLPFTARKLLQEVCQK